MWGRVDGEPKIVVAKDVMSRLVRQLSADAKAGLTAYGHRRKGDCLDIESLVALGSLERDATIKPLDGPIALCITPPTATGRNESGRAVVRDIGESGGEK